MQEKGAGGMPDQLFIEVDPHVHVVIGGGREASGDPFPGQGQRESTALGLQGKRSVLELHGSSDNWLNSTHVLLAVGGSGEDGGLRHLVLADSPYLVAMALIDQQGRRALPLGGRSQKEVAPQGEAPEALGHALVLELLLRVWQRSDQGALQRAAGADSLLLVELPMERLPEDVPRLKADWLNTGDTAAFKAALQAFSPRAWTVSIEKFKPVALQPLW